MITLILEERGEYEVVGTARNGREALELLDSCRPELITLDLDMPVMSGSDMMSALRRRSQVPVVIVSGLPDAISPDPGSPDWAPVGFVAKVLSDRPLDLSLFAAELAEAIRETCAQVRRPAGQADPA